MMAHLDFPRSFFDHWNISETIINRIAIINELGGVAELRNNMLYVDARGICHHNIPMLLGQMIHGSMYLCPALSVALGEFTYYGSGGCQIGDNEANNSRPIQHIMEVLSKFGVHISFAEKCISGKMCPVENIDEIDIMSFSTDAHTLSGPLVGGATKTALILAVNKERFVIKNAYLKTDVMDMLRFLDSIGKNVEIIGPDIIIQGAVKRNIVYETPFSLTQCISEIITYSILCLASGKKVRFLNLNRTTIERSLAPEFSLFKQMGVVTVWQGTDLIVYAPTKINSIDIVVQPSTIQSDHHPFFALLLLFGQKQVTLTEYVWKDRFKYIENLQKMGAIINVNGNQITITPSELKKYEGNLPALDVRSAAVTLVASIVSRSHVDIIDAHHIFRGYSRLKQNMQELGIELVCDIS